MPVAHLPPARCTGNTRERDSPSQNYEIEIITKQIIARAGGTLLALAGTAAHAQSSVTLYGIVDTGVERVSRVAQGANKGPMVHEQSGNLTGSHWGLKESEGLGGGYKAVMMLEGGFNSDTSTLEQSGRLFDRKAFVGLTTSSGTPTLGRHQNLLCESMFKYDPLTLSPSYSAQNMDSQFVNHANNPMCHGLNLGGMTFATLYSVGSDTTIQNGGEMSDTSKVGHEMSATILYDQGPSSVGVTYDQLQGTSITTQSSTQQRTLLGLLYQIRPVKALAGLRWLNTRSTNTPPSSWLCWGDMTQQVNAPLSISVSIYYAHFRESSGGPIMGTLLVDYVLSKRTDVYAEGAYIANRSTTSVGIRGTGVNAVAGMNQAGVMVGIRHLL